MLVYLHFGMGKDQKCTISLIGLRNFAKTRKVSLTIVTDYYTSIVMMRMLKKNFLYVYDFFRGYAVKFFKWFPNCKEDKLNFLIPT